MSAADAIPIDSDDESDIEDDGSKRPQALVDLYDIISKLEAPGTYACGGALPSIYPGLHINGYGDVSLPLREHDAKQIINLCQQAPFGRGSETIVDTTVRNTWQLSPSEVQFLNKEFVQHINALVSTTIAVELGLGLSATVGAQFYKLLLYEPGGFFVPHKDTEKTAGMFGSLVVTLPSTFAGGELIVHHQGMSKQFTVDNPSFSMSYVAFFADCKHEIMPVRSGYRLALVYNLVSLGLGPLPSPASNESVRSAIECIKKWKESTASGRKVVFVLQHEYTPMGRSFQVLKNKDRAVAQLLQEAIKDEPDLELTLALLDFSQSGCGSSKHDVDYDHEEAQIGSIINTKGEKFGVNIPISLADFYPAGAFNALKPDEKSVEEATGNEGATAELRYHRAVILVWDKADWLDLTCSGVQSDVVAHLTNEISKCSAMEARDAPDWLKCKQIASLIIEKHDDMKADGLFLQALTRLGDVELLKKYVGKMEKYRSYGYKGDIAQFYPAFDTCLATFGWDALLPQLEHLFYTLNYDRQKFLEYFAKSFEKRDPRQQEIIKYHVHRHLNDRHASNDLMYQRSVVEIVKLLCTVDPTALPKVFTVIQANFTNKDIDLIPLLRKLKEEVPSIAQTDDYIKLVQICIGELQQRIATALAIPDSWAYNTDKYCCCEDCANIKVFLQNPTQMEFRQKAQVKIFDHIKTSLKAVYPDLFSFKQEGNYPKTMVINKVSKEIDLGLKRSKTDEETVEQLNALLENDPDQRANKRRKITNNE